MLALSSPCVLALSMTDQVASEGQPVSKDAVERYGWPAEALELVNHPSRSNGWNTWFSEWPNDVNHYEFKLRGQNDLNEIIQKLAAVRSDTVQIILGPGKEPVEFDLPGGNGIAAVFAIGGQKIVDVWYLRLPEVKPGIREFGAHRYTECPKTLEPTLTLFAGNSAIDLAQLKIPTRIKVSASISDDYRKKHAKDPLVDAIDAFITEHKKKQEAAKTPSKG